MGLPVVETLREVWSNLRLRRSELIRVLAVPAIIVAALDFIFWTKLSYWASESQALMLSLVLMLSVALVISLFWALLAVSCHRVLLEDPREPTPIDGIWISSRQVRYILMAIVVALPALIHSFLAPWRMVIWYKMTGAFDVPEYARLALSWGTFIPLQYFSSRIALTLPAAALQQPMSLARAWKLSRGNGWRLTAVILAAPVAFALLRPIIELALSTFPVVYGGVRTIFSLFVGVVAIAGLSYSYRWIVNERHPSDT